MARLVTGEVLSFFKQTNFVSFHQSLKLLIVVFFLSNVSQSSETVSRITGRNNNVQTEKFGNSEKVYGRDDEQKNALGKRRVDPFIEFYTGVSTADVDKQNLMRIHSEVISKLRLSDEMKQSEAEHNRKEMSIDSIRVMERLYSALNFGHLPDKEILVSGVPADVESFWNLIHKDVSSVGSFLEIGDCVTSFQIAADYPNISVVALSMSEDHLTFCEQNAQGGGLLNYYLAYVKPGDLSELIENLYSNPQVLFENLLLTNLTELAADLLPHELEELLARVLSLARQTFSINNHKGANSKLSYFTSQWTSPRNLIEKSCELGGLACSIINPYVGDLWKNDGRVYRVNIRQGARDMPDRVCIKIAGLPDCVLMFSNESEKVVIESESKERIHPIVRDPNTIPLSILVHMNPVQVTREKLFNQMLDLPYPLIRNPSRQGLALALRGPRIVWAQISVPARDVSTSSDGSSNTDQMFDEPMPPMESKKFYVQVDNILSQEEGVDRTWERVGQVDSKGEELKTLGSHWQRESLFRVIDKDRVAAVEIDTVWSREKDVERGGQKLSREEPNKKSAELILNGEEPGLTNDEKELQKAIGLLYGKSENTDKNMVKMNKSPLNSLKFDKKEEKVNLPNVLDVPVQQALPSDVLNTSVVLNRMIPPETLVAPVDEPSNQIPSKLKALQKMEINSVNKDTTKVGKNGPAQQIPLKQRVNQKHFPRKTVQPPGIRRLRQRHLLSLPELGQSGLKDRRSHLLSAITNFSSELKSKDAVPNIKVKDSVKLQGKSSEETPKAKSYGRGKNSNTREITATEKSQPSLLKQHAFSYRRGDHQWYDHYWRILHPLFKKEADLGDANFNLLTFGGEAQSLLGLKVATSFPSSTVITVMSTTSQPILSNYRQAMQTLTRKNCLLLVNDMTPDVLNDLYHLPELFRFQVLGVEIFSALISLSHGFLYYFGQWLTLSRTTILEVPDPQLLLLAYSTLQPPGGQEGQPIPIIKGFIEAALKLVGAQASNIEILAGTHHHGYKPTNQRRLLRIEIDSMHRQVLPSCSSGLTEFQLRPGGVAYFNQVTSKEESSFTAIGRASCGVGLEFLLRIGPSSKERKILFEKYLKLLIHEDMCPTHLVYFNETLLYHPVTSPSHLHTNYQEQKSHDIQTLLEMFSAELGPQPFSFMEYNSREGALISSLTFKYRNSTFISLQEEITQAEKLYKDVKGENLDNLVISWMDISRAFTRKLVKSPDFLRYQFISSEEFQDLIKKTSRVEFHQLLGEILATSVTTFIQVPSDQIFSLAMSTFFPEAYTGVSTTTTGAQQKAVHFMRDTHPLPVYKGSELKFIKESAKADLNVTISAEVISPESTSLIEGATQSWKLLRVDVRNLSVQVDHHFDFSVDGHSRKYRQHCISHNKTSYEVFLIREQDGFEIPYGNVYAISLIALLRMGLLPAIKAKFYEKFLKLPLYEDMAPWNIVFQAGELDYIDYDSKDVTFDKMVPAAYQILAMLMNYERTVKDFGHCGDHASNPYQFKLISNCVGGSEFKGPCKDSRYPVPCGDHTCRSTFIECLQVLNDLEKTKGVALTAIKTELGGILSNERRSDESGSEMDLNHGVWSYNHRGVIKET